MTYYGVIVGSFQEGTEEFIYLRYPNTKWEHKVFVYKREKEFLLYRKEMGTFILVDEKDIYDRIHSSASSF